MTCKCSDSVHLAICSKCNEEYIGETREGKTRVPKRVQVYQQQIRQPQYQQLKCDEHFRFLQTTFKQQILKEATKL